jgi:DNA repair protein RadC
MSESKQQQDKPHYHGHRDRLRQRLLGKGGEALADYEILEFLLFGAKPRTDTKPLAKALMKRFGSLSAVLAAEPSELAEVPDLGDASIAALKIVPEAARRLAREQILGQPVLSSWGKLLDYCRISLAHEKVERFHLLFLDRQNRLIADETQQRGTVDHTPVYPREVVRRALELGATALILVHNHPSGDPTPSNADIEMTREIVAAGEKLGIAVHDHVVIAKSGETSFKSAGLL